MDEAGLRPIERRMRKLAAAGVDDVEIAWRFRCTPRTVRNTRAWAELPRPQRTATTTATATPIATLRPIERRVLRWRDDGAALADLAPLFRRGPAYLEQVEQLARLKRGH